MGAKRAPMERQCENCGSRTLPLQFLRGSREGKAIRAIIALSAFLATQLHIPTAASALAEAPSIDAQPAPDGVRIRRTRTRPRQSYPGPEGHC